MTKLMLVIAFSFVSFAHAAGDKGYVKMDAKQPIEIDSWDSSSQTYEITNLNYPGQGPLIVTPEELARTVPEIKLQDIKNDPESIVKSQYKKTSKQMNLLGPELLEARRKKLTEKR